MDTIVATITAAGVAERAALRLSGPEAWSIAAAVLEVLEPPVPGRIGRARLDLGDGVHAPIELLGFRAPRSYTGEDVIELHLEGWPVLVSELLVRLVAAGARPAERGEFTRRAVATGRLDVTAGIAVGRLVMARSVEEAADAAALLGGELSALHGRLRECLLDALALIEAHVDFEEEDTEAISEADLQRALGDALRLAERLAERSAGQPARDGETDVALVGPPNAGKSLLFLALCPGAETTVSPVPGTTRDMLEARVGQAGRRYRLLDGPGIDRVDGRLSELDRRAMDGYLANLPAHAVVLDVEDASLPADPQATAARRAVLGDRPVVAVLNKCDLVGETGDRDGLAVSALRRTGLEALWRAVETVAPAPRAPDAASALEREAARAIVPLLREVLASHASEALPLVSLALREALLRLDDAERRATDVDEELLDRIFSSFCIGK
jgi:tRNA modification GTPase